MYAYLGERSRTLQALAKVFTVSFLALYLAKGDMYLSLRFFPGMSPSLLFVTIAGIWYLGLILSGRMSRCWRILSAAESVLLPFAGLALISLWGVMVRFNVLPAEVQPLFFPWLDLFVFSAGLVLGGEAVPDRTWRTALLLAFAVTAFSIGVDVVLPGTFSEVPARAAGIAQNPNGGALIIVLLTACVLPWERPQWSRGVAALLTAGAIAVFMTLSRAGILLWGLLLLRYILLARRNDTPHGGWVLLLCAGAGVLGLLAAGRAGVVPMFNLPSNRTHLVLGEGGHMLGMATEERLVALRRSVARIERAPWLGNGSGVSYEMTVGPHNMYLARWVDNGVLGLAAYLWLLGALLVLAYRTDSRQAQALAWIMVIFGLFSHNVLEDRTLLLLLGGSLGRALRAQLAVGGDRECIVYAQGTDQKSAVPAPPGT